MTNPRWATVRQKEMNLNFWIKKIAVKRVVCLICADWPVAACHSNLRNTFLVIAFPFFFFFFFSEHWTMTDQRAPTTASRWGPQTRVAPRFPARPTWGWRWLTSMTRPLSSLLSQARSTRCWKMRPVTRSSPRWRRQTRMGTLSPTALPVSGLICSVLTPVC